MRTGISLAVFGLVAGLSGSASAQLAFDDPLCMVSQEGDQCVDMGCHAAGGQCNAQVGVLPDGREVLGCSCDFPRPRPCQVKRLTSTGVPVCVDLHCEEPGVYDCAFCQRGHELADCRCPRRIVRDTAAAPAENNDDESSASQDEQ